MSRIKVLIAEDDITIQELYQEGLAEDTFEKRFAENGRDALDLYRDWRPDVIVLDILMPVMTGYSVLQEIRDRLEDKSTPIIMATSMANSQDVHDCVQYGIQGYILKPFKLKDIGNRILYYLQKE